MNCLVISATALEIAPFLHQCRSSDKPGAIDLDILITGIGLMACTYRLQKQVYIKKPDLIIQAGIGGCFNKQIELGKVFAVKQDTVADLGVMENKQLKSMFDAGLISPNQFPYKKGWLTNPHKALLKRTGLKSVSGISVNQVSTSKQMVTEYQSRFEPVLESMEGAALHYVALMENIPFIQIRSASNYVMERNKKKWKMRESIESLNKALAQLLDSL